MTLGQCLDIIRQHKLKGDVQAMTHLGTQLVRKIRAEFAGNPTYPKSGWLVFFSEENLYVIHQKAKIRIEEAMRTPRTNPFLPDPCTSFGGRGGEKSSSSSSLGLMESAAPPVSEDFPDNIRHLKNYRRENK